VIARKLTLATIAGTLALVALPGAASADIDICNER
jgi:hypothetical protein